MDANHDVASCNAGDEGTVVVLTRRSKEMLLLSSRPQGWRRAACCISSATVTRRTWLGRRRPSSASCPRRGGSLDAARQRRLGVDVIAVLALVGTLVVREYLAGAVVTVMLASGRTLEARAAARARRELRLLLERAPRIVHRYADGELTSPPLEEVRPGDLLLVAAGRGRAGRRSGRARRSRSSTRAR